MGQRLLRLKQHLRGRCLLQQTAVLHHRHALAPAARHGQIVGDQQQRTARLLAQRRELSHHLTSHRHIEAGGGLIGDHQRRLQGHGQGDRHPLAHATTELMRITVHPLRANAHALQQLLGPRGLGPMGREGVAQVIANADQRIQAGHRVLKDQAHRLTPQTVQRPAPQTPGIAAEQFQATLTAAALGQQTQNSSGNRAFAATGGPHQGQPLTALEAQGQAIKGGIGGAWVGHHQIL